MSNHLAKFCSISIIAILLSSCFREAEVPSTNLNVAAPIFKSRLNISNLIADSLVRSNTDSSISLVYDFGVPGYEPDSLVKIPKTTYTKNATINSLRLGNQNFQSRISLGQLAGQITGGGLIINFHNDTLPLLPPANNIAIGQQQIDITNVLRTATLDSGTMELSITNEFPVAIRNVQFDILNVNSGTIIVTDNINLIPSGSTTTRSYSLNGQTLDGLIAVDISNVDIDGGTFVPVDTADALVASIIVKDIKVQSATAIFPAQNIVDEISEVDLNIQDGLQLTDANISEGDLRIELVSTMQDFVYFEYKIPSASLNGVQFYLNDSVSPAPPGGVESVNQPFDFKGYDLDLTGQNGDKFNTFLSEITGRIDSTGKIVSLTTQDSFFINITTEALSPNYIVGFLGNDTLSLGPEEVEFDLFENLSADSLALDNIILNANLESGIGIPAEYIIDTVYALNSKTGQTVYLSGAQIGARSTLNKASRSGDSFSTATTNVTFSNSGTNITDLFSILPDKIAFSARIFTNPGIDSSNTDFEDFIFQSSTIDPELEVEVPLNLLAKNLTLQDTVDFNLGTNENTDNISQGVFYLIAENGYPLSADISLIFLDNNQMVVDSLVSSTIVQSGTISGPANTITSQKSVIEFPVDKAKIDRISSATRAIIKGSFSTPDDGNKYKIYSTQGLDITLSAKFEYKLE